MTINVLVKQLLCVEIKARNNLLYIRLMYSVLFAE